MQGKGSTSKALVSWKSASSFEQASPFRSMAAGPGTREPITLTEGTLLTASTAAPPTPAPSTTAPTAEKLDYLNAQLNTFTEQDVVLGRFKMLGEWERRQGGAAPPPPPPPVCARSPRNRSYNSALVSSACAATGCSAWFRRKCGHQHLMSPHAQLEWTEACARSSAATAGENWVARAHGWRPSKLRGSSDA